MTTSFWIIASSILSAIGAYAVGFVLGRAAGRRAAGRQRRDIMGASLDCACDEMESVLAHHANDLSPMVRHSLRITIEDAERTLVIAGIRERKEK